MSIFTIKIHLAKKMITSLSLVKQIAISQLHIYHHQLYTNKIYVKMPSLLKHPLQQRNLIVISELGLPSVVVPLLVQLVSALRVVVRVNALRMVVTSQRILNNSQNVT